MKANQCKFCKITMQLIEQAHRDATEEVVKAHKRGWEQAKEESRRTIQQLEATNRALLDQLSKGITLRAAPVMMADAEAHRMGWEQCKFEAMTKSTGRSYDAIAALEYKEPAK